MRKLQRIIERSEDDSTDPEVIDAHFAMGYHYEHGVDGVPRDLKSAHVSYETAALAGHAQAAYFLGMMYLEGRGLPESFDSAARMFRQAGDKGHAGARHRRRPASAGVSPSSHTSSPKSRPPLHGPLKVTSDFVTRPVDL